MFPIDTDFETRVTLETESMPMSEDLPFHILFLGDWSGKESRLAGSDLSNSRPIEIDRDNFDDVMKNFRIGLDLDFRGDGENVLSINFSKLDDFHPDNIFQRLPLFANLQDIRRKLVNRDSFNEAAKEVRSWIIDTENVEKNELEAQNLSSEIKQPAPDNILDQILGKTEQNVAPSKSINAESSELSGLIKKLVKPHLIEVDTAEQSKLLIIIDEVISDLMRKILHHPQFQALESAWRGVDLFVRRIESDAYLKLFLLDISKTELAKDLKSVGDLGESYIYQILVENPAKPWAVVCGDYTFKLNVDDVAVLIRLAKLGNVANTPFISHVRPEMFGFDSFDLDSVSDRWCVTEDSTEGKLWETLRSLSEANYLGLMSPRYLTRLPYGEKTEPTESFYFEELTELNEHEQYLWANPSFVCALLLAQSFQKYGWEMEQNLIQDLDNLPIHLFQENGEAKTKPCAEIVMTQNNCEILLEQGLMPLISFRNSDRVRLGRFQSIALDSSVLSGRWN